MPPPIDKDQLKTLKPGETISLPVYTPEDRPYFLAENSVVVINPMGMIEIGYVRTNMVVTAQTMKVQEVNAEGFSASDAQYEAAPELREVGRVALTIDTAANLAGALLQHLLKNNLMSADVIKQKLTERGVL